MRHLLRRAWAPLLTAALTLAPALIWASEAAGEGGGRSPVYDLVMKFINFAILAGILFYFLRKPVSQGLADRRESIKKELEEALQAKEVAEAKYQEYQAKVANLEVEIRQLQADFKAEGERQQARIIADAEKASQGIRRQAEAAANTEVKRAADELRAEAAELAVRLAEAILAKAYTTEDQKKAVELTIQNIERVH